jgi:hypothetical protein
MNKWLIKIKILNPDDKNEITVEKFDVNYSNDVEEELTFDDEKGNISLEFIKKIIIYSF